MVLASISAVSGVVVLAAVVGVFVAFGLLARKLEKAAKRTLRVAAEHLKLEYAPHVQTRGASHAPKEAAVPVLEPLLESRVPEEQLLAIEGLRKLGSPIGFEEIRPFCAAKSREIRALAARVLMTYDGHVPPSIPFNPGSATSMPVG